jgi:hypothetical protein
MGCLDGHKYVCLDDFYMDVIDQKCLIYSFGINNEWSFEENMIDIGCTVRTFDPTIDGSTMPQSSLISFQKIGLSDEPGVLNIGEVRNDFLQNFITKENSNTNFEGLF